MLDPAFLWCASQDEARKSFPRSLVTKNPQFFYGNDWIDLDDLGAWLGQQEDLCGGGRRRDGMCTGAFCSASEDLGHLGAVLGWNRTFRVFIFIDNSVPRFFFVIE
ncbi:hypothetical protein B0H19DRAFT_1079514 [Mycena capillaripes]|nr:hypothetical protein B0H19DRAFT_1079514 [Mycena capillaripes]